MMSRQKKSPSKPKTTLGVTKITGSSNGETEATYIPDDIPTNKEERELYYAKAFIKKFNADLPFGPDVKIKDFEQNDTSDLDFKIECPMADYLELAAIKPLTEIFGQEIMKSGRVDVYELSEWIYENLIRRKFKKYGDLSGKIFLLIYTEDWQLILNDNVRTCIAGFLQYKGCDFSGVFEIMLNPMGLVIQNPLAPNFSELPSPEEFRGKYFFNFQPGQSSWQLPPMS